MRGKQIPSFPDNRSEATECRLMKNQANAQADNEQMQEIETVSTFSSMLRERTFRRSDKKKPLVVCERTGFDHPAILGVGKFS